MLPRALSYFFVNVPVTCYCRETHSTSLRDPMSDSVLQQHMVQHIFPVSCILYYSSVLLTSSHSQKSTSMSSLTSYDRYGAQYNVTAIINENMTLNLNSYKTYSPLFLSMTFALSYGLSFASITATITHTILYFRKQIWAQSRKSLSEQEDIHARLMARYPSVPDWWYVAVFGS